MDKTTGVRSSGLGQASTEVVDKRRTLGDLAQGAYADLVGSLGVLDTIDYKTFGGESAGLKSPDPASLESYLSNIAALASEVHRRLSVLSSGLS